jgi:maltose O-acetyltransferase
MLFKLLFGTYAYVLHLFYGILDLLPQFLRSPIFKLVFGGYMGNGTYIDYKCYFRYPSRIRIGNNTTINRSCSFYGSYHHNDVIISIGNNVAIAPSCSFFAAGHDINSASLKNTAKSITVGDKVWIGGESIILGGADIGEGAVIAAGSLVRGSVEPYTVVGGIPAKFIKQRDILYP